MAQVVISDFKYGLDRTRPRVAGIPGTLWAGVNVHISRGGDIERAKKFVEAYDLPAGTFGMGQVRGQLYVFGSADLSGLMPNGVQYQRLVAPNSPAMVRVLFNNTFDGAHYVIADYADGNIHHFYDGTRVDELDSLADLNASYTTLAEYLAEKINANAAVEALSFGSTILVTAVTPGTAFTLAAATVDVGGTDDQTAVVSAVQANVAAVAEVRATGTVTITGGTRDPNVNTVEQVTVDGVELMGVPVSWVTSNSATATAVAAEINNRSATHGFAASANGAIVTITAEPGAGATPNGDVVAVVVDGNVTASTANMAGGVTEVEAVAQISKVVFGGTFEPADRFTITVNGTDYVATGRASGQGTSCFTYKGREFLTAGSAYRYCKLNDPTDFTDATASTGAGFINMANDSEGNERLVGSAQYNNQVAIFARKSVRIYSISADAAENAFQQSMENAGTSAPRSAAAFATTEVLYLDEPGIRSLQVRDINGNAYVDDIGSPIDPLVTEWVASLSEDVVGRAVAVVEPVDGRWMLAIGERIFVLSYFPRKKITAWSYYEPGFTVTDFARVKRRLYARDEDKVYLYGGADGATYPDAGEQTCTVALPFVSAQNPAQFKKWEGIDIACENTWNLTLLVDPTNDAKTISIGQVVGATYHLPHIAAIGEHPMFSLLAECDSAGYASISSVAAHYTPVKPG